MKKLLLACIALLAFACSNDDTTTVDPVNENPENPTPENPQQENPDSTVDCVYVGSVTLQTQDEVDDFAANNYCEITRGLTVTAGLEQTNDITSLAGLSSLKKVGSITIDRNPNLETLYGLQNIRWTGTLTVTNNDSLITMSGLEGLNASGEDYFYGFFTIKNNASLTTLEGLGPIRKIDILHISGNALQNLNGLEHLEIVNNNLSIGYSPALTSISGLSGLKNVNLLGIDNAPLLSSVQPLNNLTECSIIILKKLGITNLNGLENLSVIDALDISENELLESLEGVQNLTSCRNISIYKNPSLVSISHLSALHVFMPATENGSSLLAISKNTALQSLDGLQNISDFSGSLSVNNNTSLTDLCTLNIIASQGQIVEYFVTGNAYNPTLQDIVNGNCSQ